MFTEQIYGHCVHVSAMRSARDRRFWSCIIGALHTDHEGQRVCDFSEDWLAVCDDFGNLVKVERRYRQPIHPESD